VARAPSRSTSPPRHRSGRPGETADAVAAFLDHLGTRTLAAPGLMCTLGHHRSLGI
jgi:hypothetical protein